MRAVELPRRRTLLPPLPDVSPVRVILHDPHVGVHRGVPVGNENVPIRGDRYIGRPVQEVALLTGDTRLSEGQEKFAVRAELEDLVPPPHRPASIGHPDVGVMVDPETVREDEHVAPEALDQIAGAVKLENGGKVRDPAARTVVVATPLEYPQVLAVRVHLDTTRRAPRPAVGELSPRRARLLI